MAFKTILLVAILAKVTVQAEIEDQPVRARQYAINSPYPVDLQYDFSQVQYPQFSGEAARIQPQVFIYPGGGASGQPFLLQPGAPPGNFLIPQPQPGFVLRDAPGGRPGVFGYPQKPQYVPPINKDAEEIPTNPGALQPNIPPTRGKPEKLETFDEKPEPQQPTAGEADVLAAADRTLGKVPALKPGHRFFILNGQPLFSNYPLPQFANSPYQPSFEPVDREFYTFRQDRPSFLPNGFSKSQDAAVDKVPIGSFFVRNSVTGEINGAKERPFELPANEIGDSQNLVSLNQRDQPTPEILFKNLPLLPYNRPKLERPYFLDSGDNDNSEERPYSSFKLDPIEVPNLDDDDASARRRKPTVTTTAEPEPEEEPTTQETPKVEKSDQPSISRSQPSALALAGPGGVAAAAPRATALSGDRGVSISSPQATAVAGPTRDQIKRKPIKSEKQ